MNKYRLMAMGEILRGMVMMLLGIISIIVLDGEGTVALFLIPAGAYYSYLQIKEARHEAE